MGFASPERVDELVKTALDIDPNLKRGASLYAAQCKQCHGVSAFGDANKLIPALAGQRRAYIIKQLADFTELERDATQMHVIVTRKGVSETQDWADLAAYLNGLKPTPTPQSGNGKYVSLGEASYRQWCASCHEDDGRGDETDSSRRFAINTMHTSFKKCARLQHRIVRTSSRT